MQAARSTLSMRRGALGAVLAAWLACAGSAGCSGRDGPQRIVVEGAATRDGSPVEKASISFLPAAGHHGPAATTMIEQGRYRLGPDEGPAAGPHRVIVEMAGDDKSAFLSAARDEGVPAGPPARRWEFEVEVPAEGPFEHDVTLDGPPQAGSP